MFLPSFLRTFLPNTKKLRLSSPLLNLFLHPHFWNALWLPPMIWSSSLAKNKADAIKSTMQRYAWYSSIHKLCKLLIIIIIIIISNIGQSDVNLSLLVLPYLRILPSSKEKISWRELNRQPLHSEMGTSLLSPNSSVSSWTGLLPINDQFLYLVR